MNRLFTSSLLFALAAPMSAPAQAQTAPASQPLTVERVYSDPSLSGQSPRALRFSPSGDAITFLRPKADDYLALDLVSEQLNGEGTRTLVDARALEVDESTLSEAERARRERMRVNAHGVVSYEWDEQGRAILAPVAGDLFVADVESGAVSRLTRTPADEIDAHFSPGGRYVGFVREQNLYVIDRSTNAEQRLSEDGAGAVSYGLAEFVVQEEFNRFSGFWFSPGDAYIAYTRTDESAVPLIQRPEINAAGVTLVEQRYPRAGANNARVELFVRELVGGGVVQADLGDNPDIYVVRVNWSASGDALYVQRVSRDQKRLDLLRIDPATGASRVVLSETSHSWVNVNDGFRALNDGGFLWLSERDGFAHLYRYDARGRLRRQVTRGAWPVRAVIGVDEANGYVFFAAGVETPIEQHLYRASYARTGAPQRLTQDAGWWVASMNDAGTAFLASYSAPSTPPQVSLRDADGHFIRWVEHNAVEGDHPYAPYRDRYLEPQFGTIPAPGAPRVQLHYRIDLPVGFDPAMRYPAIVRVYGGPHAQTVTRGWTAAQTRLYQEHGYVVFALDNRGSENRGVAFESALGGRFGDVEARDQLAGLAYLRALPYVDPDRVGVTGWSYGGYMVATLLSRHPGSFNAGVAGAPVIDWRLYDTAYTERYLGMPDAPGDIYRDSSPLAAAANVRDPLLILHGMADDNVTFDNTTQFVAALQQAGVGFEFMAYPGQRHGLYARWASRHARQQELDFFAQALAPR